MYAKRFILSTLLCGVLGPPIGAALVVVTDPGMLSTPIWSMLFVLLVLSYWFAGPPALVGGALTVMSSLWLEDIKLLCLLSAVAGFAVMIGGGLFNQTVFVRLSHISISRADLTAAVIGATSAVPCTLVCWRLGLLPVKRKAAE